MADGGRFAYGWKQWAPQGGLSRPWIDEPLDTSRVAVPFGARNGTPDLLPYVWNIGEKLRRAQVDARLRAVRELAGFEHVTGYYDRPAKAERNDPLDYRTCNSCACCTRSGCNPDQCGEDDHFPCPCTSGR